MVQVTLGKPFSPLIGSQGMRRRDPSTVTVLIGGGMLKPRSSVAAEPVERKKQIVVRNDEDLEALITTSLVDN